MEHIYKCNFRRGARMGGLKVACGLALIVFQSGCTSWEVQHDTAAVSATLPDIYIRTILDNVARCGDQSPAAPSFSLVTAGQIQITDTMMVGNPNLSYMWSPWMWSTGFSPSRKWQETWTIAPVTDKHTLDMLDGRFRAVAGEGWIQHGPKSPPPLAGHVNFIGHYGTNYVWTSDVEALSNLAFTVMDIIATNAPSAGVAPAGPPAAAGYNIQ